MHLSPAVVESMDQAAKRGAVDAMAMLRGLKNRAIVIGSEDFVEWARIMTTHYPQPWYAPLQFSIEWAPVRMSDGELLASGMDGYDNAPSELVEVVVIPNQVAHLFVRREWGFNPESYSATPPPPQTPPVAPSRSSV